MTLLIVCFFVCTFYFYYYYCHHHYLFLGLFLSFLFLEGVGHLFSSFSNYTIFPGLLCYQRAWFVGKFQRATQIATSCDTFDTSVGWNEMFYLFGVRHMVKDHSDSEKGNPLLPHRLPFPINSKGSFISIISQTG